MKSVSEEPATRADATNGADDDTALVARCLGGDGDAWAALVDRHGPLVWAVAKRLGLGHEDSLDVFQNTWSTALEELSRLRDAKAFPAWIGRVARHQAMRVRRGYGIARRHAPNLAREDLDETLPDEALSALEDRSRVRVALSRIGERCRELLSLLYEADPSPSYEEIGRRLAMRIGSIGPTRARCLAKLMDEIGDDDA
jgi:RNA polymerase sigma factor (sigma-70 family)